MDWFVLNYNTNLILPIFWPVELVTSLDLIFSNSFSSIIFNSEINPAIAVSAALAAPSKILTTSADFISGINAKNTPSAPFLKNIFPLESFVKIQLILFVPPVNYGNFVHELKIFLAICVF